MMLIAAFLIGGACALLQPKQPQSMIATILLITALAVVL